MNGQQYPYTVLVKEMLSGFARVMLVTDDTSITLAWFPLVSEANAYAVSVSEATGFDCQTLEGGVL